MFQSQQQTHVTDIQEKEIKTSINLLYIEGTIEKLQCILRFHKIRSTFYTKALYINFIKSFLLIDKFYCFWQGLHISFKGYLHYKTVFCNKVALDVQLMNNFIWRKNNVLFLRYLDFCAFGKCMDLKICDIIISITK